MTEQVLSPGPCSTCGATEDRCLDTILHGGDGDPGQCCADCDHPEASGRLSSQTCPTCQGRGTVYDRTCPTCGGRTIVPVPGWGTTHEDDCHRREGGTYCDCKSGRVATHHRDCTLTKPHDGECCICGPGSAVCGRSCPATTLPPFEDEGRVASCFVCGDEHTDERHRLLILNGVEAWRAGRTTTPCTHPLPDLGRFEQDVCHACGTDVAAGRGTTRQPHPSYCPFHACQRVVCRCGILPDLPGRGTTLREQVARAIAEAADDGVFDRDEPDSTSDDEDRDYWLRLADAALAAHATADWREQITSREAIRSELIRQHLAGECVVSPPASPLSPS